MPFGLTNAPATFQGFMNYVFQPFFGASIRFFFYDFCIYSKRETHCQTVERGLQKLHSLNSQLNPDKCHISQKRVTLLGHVVSFEGIEADLLKIRDLTTLPPSTAAKQLVTFLQKVRYLARFIHLLA